MKRRMRFLALAIFAACASASAQSPTNAVPLLSSTLVSSQTGDQRESAHVDLHALTGVWRAQMDGLPAIDLVISDEGRDLSGAIVFFLHMRATENDPWTSKPGLPEPILNPMFDGKTLSFQVSHRRAHPPRTLSDPPVSFRLRLIGPDRAGLVNEAEPPKDNNAGLVMVRTDR